MEDGALCRCGRLDNNDAHICLVCPAEGYTFFKCELAFDLSLDLFTDDFERRFVLLHLRPPLTKPVGPNKGLQAVLPDTDQISADILISVGTARN